MSPKKDRPWISSYDPGVRPDVEIPDISYTSFLIEGMRSNPDRIALNYLGKQITFRELDNLSAQFAAFLTANDCSQGDVVGINLPNIPQYLIALVGALRAGCSVTGISPLLTPKEYAYQLNDCGAKVLVIMDVLFEQRVMSILNDLPALKHISVANVGDFLPWIKRFLGRLLKKIPTANIGQGHPQQVTHFNDILSSYMTIPWKDISISPESTCLIQYTGGTTGVPKGTVLTHRNLVSNITQSREWIDFLPGEDSVCSGFPYFHLAGLTLGMLAICTSNTQSLIPDPRNTTHICNEIIKYKPTCLANVPTLYHMLMENPLFKTIDFSSIKYCISGAAPFSVEGINDLESYVGKGKVLEVYGMTETSPLMTMNPAKGKKKPGTVGVPISNTFIKIVDVATGENEMPLGEEGELIVQGPQVMKEYFLKPKETAHTLRTFQNGIWLYTGDVAKMDEEGYITIVDRVKDMINVGGFKVFSREVEETLYEHPAIEFCAIIGIPNKDRPGSELVKAVIQISKDHSNQSTDALKEDILLYCKKNMAAYKVPKFIEFVDAIPLTAVGKVDKKSLRK